MCFKLKSPWLHQAGAPAAQQKRDQEGGKYLPHLPDPAAPVAPVNPVIAATAPVRLFIAF